MTTKCLAIPEFFDRDRVSQTYRVPYQARAHDAKAWARQHNISPSTEDKQRICLLAIDVQNTFCLPNFELFVGGRSGTSAVDDTIRLCEFVYQHLNRITEIVPTLDTHTATQIFHPIFWVDSNGNPPEPMTLIELNDVIEEKWRVNPAMAASLQRSLESLQEFARHYTRSLSQNGKYPLTIWPYHSMLGGLGHALVSAFEEACFVHNIARQHQTRFELKGGHPLTEHYSVLRPEILAEPLSGTRIDPAGNAQKNTALIHHLLGFDAILVAGQAKSHCVAWTIEDLLNEIEQRDPRLAQKVYLLEDCTSVVVVPGVVDFTEQAEAAYARFAEAGMKRTCSTQIFEQYL
ncbi:MAG: isochorismatase [Synechococcales cyanobacterium CRU_2_2]|nr:isochorismatase [Synechococcales cyanobacterium CRU_2_2]